MKTSFWIYFYFLNRKKWIYCDDHINIGSENDFPKSLGSFFRLPRPSYQLVTSFYGFQLLRPLISIRISILVSYLTKKKKIKKNVFVVFYMLFNRIIWFKSSFNDSGIISRQFFREHKKKYVTIISFQKKINDFFFSEMT